MLNKTAIRVAAVGVMAASLIGASVTAASAAPGLNGSDAEVYIYDAGEETRFATGTVHDWDAELIGVGSATDAYGRFQCSSDTETTRTFIAPRGQERTISAWTAYADGAFIPGSNKEVQQFAAKLSGQVLGSASQVKANGGEYSLGMACLIYNGVALAKSGVFYAPITVEKGTGNWTVQEPTGTTTPTEPPAGAQTGDIDLEAVVPAPTDGALSLNVPAGAKATIGNATVVDGVSTATGTLPAFTVADARAASKHQRRRQRHDRQEAARPQAVRVGRSPRRHLAGRRAEGRFVGLPRRLRDERSRHRRGQPHAGRRAHVRRPE
jgi:hypothetical protein